MQDKPISISEMAAIHGISRQTLIYYDKIGLFKPIFTESNGYRCYSPRQIPYLREICFLKSVGLTLEEISRQFEDRNPTKALQAMEKRSQEIEKEIRRLEQTRLYLYHRMKVYKQAEEYIAHTLEPMVQDFPTRQVIFVPFEGDVDKSRLHVTTMKAWRVLTDYEMLPSNGFGTLLKKESVHQENFLENAGIFISLPFVQEGLDIPEARVLPAGRYVTMYKYGMPYDNSHLNKLLAWMEERGYTVCGDVVDACIFDTTFYQKDLQLDFCQLQIPVKLF